MAGTLGSPDLDGSSRARVKVPNRRRAELGMLVISGVITTIAYYLAYYGLHPNARPTLSIDLAVVVLIPFGLNLANRFLAPTADPSIAPLVALLNGIGYVMIFRLDPQEARLQVIWTVLGVLAYALTLVLVRNPDVLDRYRYLLAIGGIALLFLPLMPVIGQNINGERLWIRLGPLSFQPVEAAKLLLSIFTASYLIEKRDILARFSLRDRRSMSNTVRALGPLGAAWIVSLLVMTAERDVGFSLLLFMTFLISLWIATANRVFVGAGLVAFGVGFLVADKTLSQVSERITTWIDPWHYAQTIGYQIVQAQYALGSGGLSGTGLGQGHPGLIPVVTSDFIFAAIGEEMGLLGTTAVVICFALLIGAGIRAALRARSDFTSLLAFSFTLIFGLQTVFILAGVVRLLPLTGVTLPFVAYGGSSLLANYVLVAVLTRISHEGNLDPEQQGMPSRFRRRAASRASAK